MTCEAKPFEVIDISQRLKDGSIEHIAQIDFAIGSIIEPQVVAVSFDVLSSVYMQEHISYSPTSRNTASTGR
jgi:hypothetical protein